jgi:hypothetical protein
MSSRRGTRSQLALDVAEYGFIYLVLTHLLYGDTSDDSAFTGPPRYSRAKAAQLLDAIADDEHDARVHGNHWHPKKPVLDEKRRPTEEWAAPTELRGGAGRARFESTGVVLALNGGESAFVRRAVNQVLRDPQLNDGVFASILGMSRLDAESLLLRL